MKRLAALGGALVATLLASTAAHAAWTRSYVISWYEPAMYYGGSEGALTPGSDCPKGANPEIDWVKVLIDAGYTPAQANWLRDPANPTRDPVHGQNQMAFRGRNRENVYINPTSTPEVGFPTVEGKIGEGFDLDGNPATGFTSPAGRPGIDNNYYRAFGCWKNYRGPPRLASSAIGANDSMKNGAWAVLLVVNGKGDDPLNDKDVTLGIYASKDKLVTSGDGEVNPDYTFRIQPDQKLEAIMKARTESGRIITEVTPEIFMHEAGGSYGGLQLLKARAEFSMKPNGELEGFIGGYMPWKPVYDGFVRSRGPIVEILGWVRLPDVYYALRRHADYSPTGEAGEKTHISYALRVFARPAYVMTPDATERQLTVASYKHLGPPPRPIPPVQFTKGVVIDGLVIPRGQKAESLPEDMLLPPKASTVAAGS